MSTSNELKRTVQKSQSGTEVAQSGTEKVSVPPSRLSKTHQDYWQSKLKKRFYEWNGQRVAVPHWQVRIAHLGRREWFNTGTPNRAAAAVQAKNIYLSLVSAGWETTVAKFKPDQLVARDCITVGEYLHAVKANSELRLTTFEIYARKFRTLLVGLFGVKSGKEKFDYVNGGRQKFLDRVHCIRLDRVTVQRVEHWKVQYLKAAERKNPLAYKRARTTVNSIIRGSKSLFAPEVWSKVKVKLPRPLPLEGVSNVAIERSRYRSTINPQSLLVAAKNELAGAKGGGATDRHQQFKILLLALGAGLRRDEIDTLSWKQLDWHRNVINIETTVHTAAKSSASEGEVDVDPGLLEILRGYMRPGGGEFVIQSANRPTHQNGASYHYRCDRHFNGLIGWLRGKGVTAQNPLHTLRKEFGSQIASQAGIFAASLALRHADIQLTRDYYLDKKQPAFLDISKLMQGSPNEEQQPIKLAT